MEVVLLLVAGLVVWWVVSRRRREAATLANIHAVRSQDAIDSRVIALLHEFPGMTDEQIATLARDELLNARIHDPVALMWASAETVARLRRTIALQHHRRAREPLPATAPKAKKRDGGVKAILPPSKVVRAKNCPHCDARIRGDAWRCPKCATYINEG
jgi:hypothetical protein